MSVTSTGGITFAVASCAAIPGVSVSVQVPGSAVLVASADGTVQLNSSTSNNALVEFRFVVDGAAITNSLHRLTVSNTAGVTPGFGTWAMTRAFALDPGMHTISVCGQLVTGSAAAFSGNAGNATTPPQTPDNLTVVILKR